MPRKSIPSATLVQAVRRYFGMQQSELAAYLGVTAAFVGHVEAGRKVLSGRVLLRLNPLAVHLPPEAEMTAPPATALPPAAPAPEPSELDWRRRQCLHRAAGLRRELASLLQRITYAERWAALPVQPGATPLRATPLTSADVARYHLLRLQAEAFEMEAAALAALLAPDNQIG